ncbi:FHA domain-containing protein [Peptostreptococcaceae bacterium AGR-M142]
MEQDYNKKLKIINYLIIFSLMILSLYIYLKIDLKNEILKFAIILFILIAIIYFFKKLKKSQVVEIDDVIRQISLLNEENQIIKQWDILDETSLVIGRNKGEVEVDINLDECINSSLIDIEHAVLNYANKRWYIEDLYSKNGVRIQKDDDYLYKISKDKPCILDKEDILHIGNTRLLIS